jgi:hypothetical protein
MKLIALTLISAFALSCNNASASKNNNTNDFQAQSYSYKCEAKAVKIAQAISDIDESNLDNVILNRYTKSAQPNKKGELETMEQFEWRSYKNGDCKLTTVVLMFNSSTEQCAYNNSGSWVDCN